MPFKKVGNDDYTSPSGRHFNGAQVRLWHANGNKFPGQSHSEGAMNKGATSKVESFAAGGPVLGRSCDFMKTPDRFRENKGQVHNFAKGAESGDCKAPAAKGKSLPAVKPRGA